MATEARLDQLYNTVTSFSEIDREKLLRRSLGEESLEKTLTSTMEDIEYKKDFAWKYAKYVHDSYVEAVRNALATIKNLMVDQSGRSNQDYIANKESFLLQIQGQLEVIRANWSHFVTAAIEERGFLQDEGIRKEYEKTVSRMQEEAEETLGKIKGESNAVIGEAKKLAEEIEAKARRTAARISVQDAQKQFKEAGRPMLIQIIIWGVLSGITLGAIFYLIHDFMSIELPEEWRWQILYYTGIRFTALGVMGTIAAYCMRILKAQLHMYQHNQHRQRVTNSIESFVESAVTPEQRDMILSQLVNAVASFGDSGLVANDKSDGQSGKFTFDYNMKGDGGSK